MDPIDFRSVYLFKKHIGIGVLLFWDKGDWKVVFATSRFYCFQFMFRHKLSKENLGDYLADPFWTLWNDLEMRKPDEKLSKFTFQFTYHPDEKLLRLDAITNIETCEDVTLTKVSDILGDEVLETPFLFWISDLQNWKHMERVDVNFPHIPANNEQEYVKNMEVVSLLANGGDNTDFFTSEGFLVVDGFNSRVQVSLTAFNSLMNLGSRYEKRKRISNTLKLVVTSITMKDGEERFCTYYPYWASWYRYVAQTFRRICKDTDGMMEPLKKVTGGAQAFRAKIEELGWGNGPTKLFWRLNDLKEGGAFEYFTTAENLNSGLAPKLLQQWIEHYKLFDDVQQQLASEEE